MVRKLLFGLIIFSAFIVNAQSFTFEVEGADVSGSTINIDVEEVDFTGNYTGSLHLILNNGSTTDKNIIFIRQNIEMDSLSGHEICDNQSCMQAATATANHIIYAPNGKLVTAGGTFYWDIHARFGVTRHGNTHELYTAYEVGTDELILGDDTIYVNLAEKVELNVIYTVLAGNELSLEVDGTDVSGTTINIDVEEIDFTGNYTGSLHLILNNGSTTDKNIIFIRQNIEMDSLSGHEICDNQSCMQAATATADHIIYAPNGKLVTAGGTFYWDIHARFSVTKNGSSHEHYTVYGVGSNELIIGDDTLFVDTIQNVELDVVYTVLNTGVNDLSKGELVSQAYPNPADYSVSFNYNLNSNGFVTIHDVTGKQIDNLELVQGIEKVTYNTSDLNNGIYFYNVYVDGVKTITNKFIVRH